MTSSSVHRRRSEFTLSDGSSLQNYRDSKHKNSYAHNRGRQTPGSLGVKDSPVQVFVNPYRTVG
jgi:hypothetical protein